MKILVTVKRVPDPETVIKVNAGGTGIVTDNVKWVVNPFDEYGIEEALRIKEKVAGSEVVLVSIGVQASQEQLRTGLAMGADRAILVKTDEQLEPLAEPRGCRLVERELDELEPGIGARLRRREQIDGIDRRPRRSSGRRGSDTLARLFLGNGAPPPPASAPAVEARESNGGDIAEIRKELAELKQSLRRRKK